MFENLEVPEDVKKRGDKLGMTPFESGVYNFTIKLAYADKSKGGAKNINVHLQEKGSDRILRSTIYVTSGDAKGNKPYYMDRNGDKNMLPGYELANDLCLLAVGKPINKIKFEKKTVSLYSFEAKAEVPTEVEVAMDLMNKEITAGIKQQLVDKNIDDGSGAYVPSGETRMNTEIDKFFRFKDGLTVTEILAKADTAKFLHDWEAKNKGVVEDKTDKKAAAKAPNAPAAGANAANPFA